MFQCIYKNIGAEELRGANPVGKACRGIGKSRDNFIPGGIGRFGGLAQNEITSVAGDSGFVKQFAQKGVIDFPNRPQPPSKSQGRFCSVRAR